jgi:hypothetical protein
MQLRTPKQINGNGRNKSSTALSTEKLTHSVNMIWKNTVVSLIARDNRLWCQTRFLIRYFTRRKKYIYLKRQNKNYWQHLRWNMFFIVYKLQNRSVNFSEGYRKFPTKTGVRLVGVQFLYGSNVSAGLCRIVESLVFPVCIQALKIDSYCF